LQRLPRGGALDGAGTALFLFQACGGSLGLGKLRGCGHADEYTSDAILWEFGAGSSVNSGPAVVDGSVYWGSGYSRSGVEGSGNTRFYAFSIGGR
jgi:polyvinyl alcohol dehydrogenase (cytochrome)